MYYLLAIAAEWSSDGITIRLLGIYRVPCETMPRSLVGALSNLSGSDAMHSCSLVEPPLSASQASLMSV